jgi:hypothetical protein
MHIPFGVEIIIQVFFAIHAARTGRYWWIFIILVFPFVGSLIYFFVEYLPEKQAFAKAKRPKNAAFQSKSIRQLKQELEITDSVKNRMNLAKAYFHSGQYSASIDLLEKSLEGVHANDLDVIEGLCHSYFHSGNLDKLFEYLEKFEALNNKELPTNLRLHKAKALEQTDNPEAALKEYEAIADIYSGEEARCRYALLLKKQGQTEKANEIFGKILKNAKFFSKQYSKLEKEWVSIAKSEIT